VQLGDHVMVGANCVVTRDVPSGSIVVVAPARVMSRSLSPVARGVDQRPSNTPAPIRNDINPESVNI
jgi:serine acetyltransferase